MNIPKFSDRMKVTMMAKPYLSNIAKKKGIGLIELGLMNIPAKYLIFGY